MDSNRLEPRAPSVAGIRPWWRELNGYHWFVFLLAAFGWMFDCFDQQIFTNSRSITMRDLIPDIHSVEGSVFVGVCQKIGFLRALIPHTTAEAQLTFGTLATSIFILGWATGGLIFGTIGDKWGRAKTMAVTILVYAACTGLSGFAQNWSTFAIFRFLTGAGVGGEFAVGAALLAEVMPDRARPHALGSLQALSAIGNILAAVSLGIVVPSDKLGWGWRGLYYIGALPALIAVFVFSRLKEPERWVAARAAAVQARTTERFGRIGDLFTNPRWRRHTLVGLGLAIAGQIGLWGVGFYTPELIDSAIPTVETQTRPRLESILNASSPEAHAAAVSALDEKEKRTYAGFLARIAAPAGKSEVPESANTPLTPQRKDRLRVLLQKAITEDEKTRLKSIGSILLQLGAILGISCFTALAARHGRRISFLIALLLAWASLIWAFSAFSRPSQIWYLWPILGFCIFAPFGGYAIYFPELFPTRLRTTGTSFCYNVGRYVTAFGVFLLGPLAQAVHGLTDLPGFRVAAMILASSYLLGINALIWAPETVNQPLPEDKIGPAH